jgi:RNA polymerase sigma factor (sigma-70 family)
MLALMRSDAALARPRALLPAALLRLAPDTHLIEQMQAGSERAFEVIFDRHHRSVLAFCRQMLGSPEEAEDAVQQTFMDAYRDLLRCEKPIVLRPWLYAIARHRCLSMLRARRQSSLERVREPVTEHLVAEVAAREDLRAILTDVARLPEDQRAALILAVLGDVSHEEIARIIGCPRDKVKALMFQARSSLASSRAARETSWDEVRDQLATLRGGALRRATIRRHLHDCPGCRRFREKMRLQRRQLALLLPVIPSVGLKRAVLGAVFGAGDSGAAGATVTAGAIGGGLFATALVAIAIPAGGIATAVLGFHNTAKAAPTKALGSRAPAPMTRPAARATAVPGHARVARPSPKPSPEHISANVKIKAETQAPKRPLRAQMDSNDTRPNAPERATDHDPPEDANSPHQPEAAKSPQSGDPAAPPKTNAPIKPANPVKWPTANGQAAPGKPPTINDHDTPAKRADPAKRPPAIAQDTPAKPAEKPPTAPPDAHAAPPANAAPSPSVAATPRDPGKASPARDARDRATS